MESEPDLDKYTLDELCRLAMALGVVRGYAPERSVRLYVDRFEFVLDLKMARDVLTTSILNHLAGRHGEVSGSA
jgi:hypothetical protein